MNVDHIARLDQCVSVRLTCPLPVFGSHHHGHFPDPRMNLKRQSRSHKSMNVISRLYTHHPVGMLVLLEVAALRQHILLRAFPSPLALVGGHSIEDCVIGRLLQIDVQSRLNAQTCFMHFFRSKLFLQFAPHFLHKPGRHRHLGLGDMQAQRRFARGIGLLFGDGLVVLHLA